MRTNQRTKPGMSGAGWQGQQRQLQRCARQRLRARTWAARGRQQGRPPRARGCRLLCSRERQNHRRSRLLKGTSWCRAPCRLLACYGCGPGRHACWPNTESILAERTYNSSRRMCQPRCSYLNVSSFSSTFVINNNRIIAMTCCSFQRCTTWSPVEIQSSKKS